MTKKRISFSILLLGVLFLISLPCGGQNKFSLPNGLVVITEKRDQVPLLYLYLLIKAGSIYEGEYLGSGISHFVEHMVFRENDKTGEVARKVRSLGGEINAYTTFDRTVYYMLIPSSHWKEGLKILIETVFNASFESKKVDSEREVILREMDLKEDDPEGFLSMHFWKTLFITHPYRFPVMGERELFKKLKRGDLVTYYERMYVPNNAILTICGSIKEKEVIKEVENITGRLSPAPLSTPLLPEEPPQASKRELRLEKDVEITYLKIGFHIPPFGHQDMYALDVLSIVLGQGRGSRLYKALKEDESLVYSISSYSFTPLYEGVFAISVTMKKENAGIVQRRIFEEIERIKNEGVKEEELKRAKEILRMQELTAQETLEGRTRELALNYLYAGDLDFTEKYLERVGEVKREDLVNVANIYLTEQRSTALLLSSPKIEKKDTEESKPPPVSITRERMKNGLTLIMREDSALPIVSIVAVAGGGLIVEEENNNGICRLLSSMLLKGTTTRSYQEIIESIESTGGNISSYSGNNSLGVKITVHKRDADMALELLADILINSEFPQEELKKEKKTQITEIAREDDDIFTYAFKNLRREFFKGHPYRFSSTGKIESVSSIKREALSKLKERLIAGENIVIAVSGDLSGEKIKEKMGKLFLAFPRGQRIEVGYPQTHQKRRLNLQGKWNQSVLLIGFPAPALNDDEHYTMEVLETYLTGQASPLFVNLRDERSLAYSVGTFSLLGWDPGMFVFYILTGKEKLKEALSGMQEEIEKLKRGEFKEEDIESAKKKLLTEKWKSLQTNESFAFQMALSELYGLGYQEPLKLEEKILRIGKKDIIRFANQYLKKEESTTLLLEGR